jgi:hypothetical protein
MEGEDVADCGGGGVGGEIYAGVADWGLLVCVFKLFGNWRED